MRPDHRQKDTSVSVRLKHCYEQGNQISSAAYKLNMNEQDVTVMYMHYALVETSNQLKEPRQRPVIIRKENRTDSS